MTQQAVSTFAVLRLLCEESPVNGDSARVSQNTFKLTPQQQNEEYVKHDQKDNEWFGFKIQHVLNDEDKVVKRHETDDSDKMRIHELSATDLPV